MSKTIIRSVKFNFFMNFILTASSFLFPLITFPYVARVLGPDRNGKISFAISVISYFQMIAQLGIPTYGIRACAKVRDNKEELSRTVHELLIINTVITAITYVIFLLSLILVPKFSDYKILLLINSMSLILNVFGMNWLYSGLEQYSYITIRSLLFKLISIVLMFLFVEQRSDYIIYGAITVFATSGSNIINILNCKRFIYTKPLGKYAFRKHLKPILTFFAMTAAISIYTNLDTVLLGFMKGDIQVGYYNIAVKIKSITATLVSSLGSVLLPRMSYFVSYNMKKEFENLVAKALNFVLLFSIPIVVYCIFYSKEIILFLAGNSYLPAIPSLKIIIPSILAIGLTSTLGIQVLVPFNKEKYTLISVIAGAIIDLGFCFIFIPYFGAFGASLATLIAEFSVLLVQVYYLKNFLPDVIKNTNLKYVVISSCIASIIIMPSKNYLKGTVFITLLISAMLFFSTYGITLLIQKEPLVSNIVSSNINKLSKILKKASQK